MAAYIKFDGIEGEAQDKDHKSWSDLASVGQGIVQPGGGSTGPTRRRGDVVLEDLHCSKELDKASPKIAESICKGKIFPKVEIHLTASTTDAGRVTYFAYELKNVMRIVLQVAVHGHDSTAARVVEPREQGILMTEIAGQADAAHPLVLS